MKFARPALLCAAPALLLMLAPVARDALLYDRTAILHGEWWRLWTGHWVHFSASHLAWNAAVLAGAGAWLERLQPGSLLRFVAVAAPLLSVSFLAGAPGMQAYGGLSGLATGVVVLLALTQWERAPRGRAWWGGVLALVALKLGVDAVRPDPLFAGFDGDVRPSALAHVAGAVIVAAFFLSRRSASWRFLSRRPAAGVSP
jgi:rhomboid family GlyGly-CTERM serine protease